MAFGDVVVKLDTRKLDYILGNIDPRAEKVLEKSARDVEDHWKDWITVKRAIDTGDYQSSVHVRREHRALEREITDGVEYGIYVEYGTTRMPARPCAQPAVDDVKPGLARAWAEVVK